MRVAVLGAGLQGACIALELAGRGVEVDLFERRPAALSGASANNEGKIHLGYTYANDPTLATARLMLRGAASFSPLLRRWVGDAVERVPVSTPFRYAVHRSSLVPVEAIDRYFRACHALAREENYGESLDYFGRDYREPPRRLASPGDGFAPHAVTTVFRTPEVAVDPEALCAVVRRCLAATPSIRLYTSTMVAGVEPDAGYCDVTLEADGHAWIERYDHAVNALWEGRLAIDSRLGLAPTRPSLMRVKYYLRLPDAAILGAVPSTTIVLGPFGDVVRYHGAAYLSWYSAGMQAMTEGTEPPPADGGPDPGWSRRTARAIVRGLAGVLPGVRAVLCDEGAYEVKGGVIVASGRTDIDDPASGLHARADIGPRTAGRYHSVNTGKLTMAPYFAMVTADRITPR